MRRVRLRSAEDFNDECESMTKKTIGKGVLTVCIVLLATGALIAGCAANGQEKTFDLGAKAREAVSAVVNAPDETKASVLDAASVVLTITGLGGAGLLAKGAAAYFRKRKKKSAEGESTADAELFPELNEEKEGEEKDAGFGS